MDSPVKAQGHPGAGQGAGSPIFVLDIGTRSIIGVVGVPEGDLFKVLGIERMEHPQRAMIDGQIEDIGQVAKVAGIVKARLEEKLDFPLRHVFVAAAGRALKTQKASAELTLAQQEPIREQQIFDLEIAAIQEARAAIDAELAEGAELYCVGHSVVRYTLDDYPISTLLGHRGKRAKAEIIATFLPSEVVESLYAAMNQAGLAVAGITLEPIAAMNAIIPKELRMLNLALVDIGAGTSDIAVSDGGSVVAYTMATIAGDEVTESIVRSYLVDFETAERIKLALGGQNERIEYRDILGYTYSVTPAEVMEKIDPSAESLSTVISERILEVNGKPPAAVFLVGGGSLLPTLCRRVAQKLSIDESKAAVGGNNYMKRMVSSEQDISGPEFATPIGIAITAMLDRANGGLSVLLNGRQVQLFQGGQLTVMDVLMMNGYKQSQLIGRAGKSVTFQLNGEKKTVRGGFPTPAEIRVNGKQAAISTPVKAGNEIEVSEASQGVDAHPVVREVAGDWDPFEVQLNGSRIPVGSTALINGVPADGGQRINNLDTVQIYSVSTLGGLCEEAKLDWQKYKFFVNGALQDAGYELCPGDDIRYFASGEEPRQADTRAEPPPEGAPAGGPVIEVVLNGRGVELSPKADGTPYLFVDMLNYVDIDPSKPEGNIVLRLNGREASYLEQVRARDNVEIYWDGSMHV